MNDDRHTSTARHVSSNQLSRVAALSIVLATLLSIGCTKPSEPSLIRAPETAPIPAPVTPPSAPGATYMLKTVDGQGLPTTSPYGSGQWDYDDDAGTWRLIEASLVLRDDGTFTNSVKHQARSGAIATQDFDGTYRTTSPSTLELHEYGNTSSATISDGRLVWTWSTGLVMTFER